jgi:hypothetical protein
MKLSDFFLLNEEEKKYIVLHQGILLAKRSNENKMVFLFQLENYYVETFCNPGSKKIEEFRVFDNTRSLQPYLDAISINELLN